MNGLRQELAGSANLMNVELGTELGDTIGEIYDVKFAGTHVLLSENSEILYKHHGKPDVDQILELVGAEKQKDAG